MKHLWEILIWTVIGLICSSFVLHASLVLIDLWAAVSEGRQIDRRSMVFGGVRFINCRIESVTNYGIYIDNRSGWATNGGATFLMESNKFIGYGKTNY